MDKLHFPPKKEFDQILKNRINNYFKDNNVKQTGNTKLHSKALILLIGTVLTYSYLIFGHQSPLSALFFTFLLIQFQILLAFNAMHDGGHQSFSNKKIINDIASWSMDFLGSSSFLWKQKHNSLHHTYTNINGKDDDIEIGSLLRLSPEQKLQPWHKFQFIYAPFLYSFLSLYLLFYSDFQRIFTKKIGTTPFSHLYRKDLIFFYSAKSLYFIYALIIPMFFHNPLVVIAYFIFGHFVFGLTLSLVFQLAHTVKETSFPAPDKNGILPFSWVEHQLNTTCDFAPGNKFVTFYCGGLNYQVEHHLFHKISHIHYPNISKIVKQTCAEFNKPYLVNQGFFQALSSHFRFLKQMGKVNGCK
jgi:linoleoyl-CoA desaturase